MTQLHAHKEIKEIILGDFCKTQSKEPLAFEQTEEDKSLVISDNNIVNLVCNLFINVRENLESFIQLTSVR